jgi:hypothetical protein
VSNRWFRPLRKHFMAVFSPKWELSHTHRFTASATPSTSNRPISVVMWSLGSSPDAMHQLDLRDEDHFPPFSGLPRGDGSYIPETVLRDGDWSFICEIGAFCFMHVARSLLTSVLRLR